MKTVFSRGGEQASQQPVPVERREHTRYQLDGIRAVFNNRIPCEVKNISAEGLMLSGVPLKESPGIGGHCAIALKVSIGGREAPVLVRGRVTREGRDGLAVNYAQPSAVWARLLELLSEREVAELLLPSSADRAEIAAAEIESLMTRLTS